MDIDGNIKVADCNDNYERYWQPETGEIPIAAPIRA